MPLTERDMAILEFERLWWADPSAKNAAIRERFELSSVRYHQILGDLIDSPEAFRVDPLAVSRLRRHRDRQARPAHPRPAMEGSC